MENHRCSGIRKDGSPCSSTFLVHGSDRCHAHQPGVDMAEIGRRGGKRSGESRRGEKSTLVKRALRRRELAWEAIDQGLQSDDERVRMSAVRAALRADERASKQTPEEFEAPSEEHRRAVYEWQMSIQPLLEKQIEKWNRDYRAAWPSEREAAESEANVEPVEAKPEPPQPELAACPPCRKRAGRGPQAGRAG